MYAFVSIFLIMAFFLGIIHKNKTPKISILIYLLFLTIMMAANVNNPDYYNYLKSYNYIEALKGSEWGYYYLAKFCSNLGVGYHQFKFIIAILGLLLIHSTVRRYLKKCTLFYLLYFLCPFMIDATQLKNFLAMSFFIFAVPFLTESTLKGKLKYVLLIVMAASFQITAFVYLPIAFLGNVEKNKLITLILIIVIILSVVIGLNRSFVIYLAGLISSSLGNFDDRIIEFSSVDTTYGFIIYWGLQIISFFLIKWAKKSYENSYQEDIQEKLLINNKNFEYKLIKLLDVINIYSFIFLPFYVIQLTYGRFLRNILPLNYIILILAYRKNKVVEGKITLHTTLMFSSLIIYAALNFYFMIYMEYNDTIIKPLFTDNWFLNMNWHEWFS